MDLYLKCKGKSLPKMDENEHYKSDDFIEWANAHRDRLVALLDKPVILFVGWKDGDLAAEVRVIPTDAGPDQDDKPFEIVSLPFPMTVSVN